MGGVNDTDDQTICFNTFANGSVMQILFKNLVADEQWWAVSTTPFINVDTADHMDHTCSRLLFSLTGISIKKSYIGNLYHTIQYLQQMLKSMG
jgi:hypothetical protein